VKNLHDIGRDPFPQTLLDWLTTDQTEQWQRTWADRVLGARYQEPQRDRYEAAIQYWTERFNRQIRDSYRNAVPGDRITVEFTIEVT
jgi:hypothetical protein